MKAIINLMQSTKTIMKNLIKTSLLSVIIFAFFSACEGIDDGTVNPEDIILLRILDDNEIEITEAIGNGESIIVLEAKIPSNSDDDFQAITFRSSGGDFIGIGENTNQVSADADGIARSSLRLPLDDDELFLSAEIGPSGNLYKAEKSIMLTGVDEVIQLRFLNLSGEELTEIPRGDGVSVIQLEGSVLTALNQFTAIDFTSSNGVFQVTNQTTDQKNIDNEGKAVVNYIVPQKAGPIFFTAKTVSTPQYVADGNLVLDRANPDALFIEPASINMNTMDPNTINVFLTRNNGHVSEETPASFEAFQVIGGAEVEVGRFTLLANAVSDDQGKIMVNFYADTGDIDSSLPVVIRVRVINDSGDEITNQIELFVN